MKNLDFSNILFSAFSPEIILYPVKNSINPVTVSEKDIISHKDSNSISNNTSKFIRPKSALNINYRDLFPQKLYDKYIIDKDTNLNKNKKNKNNNDNKLYSSFVFKPLEKKSFSQKSLFFNNESMNNLHQKNYKKININKIMKSNEEPYKKYLIDKRKIESFKKLKELENKYIMESKRQKQLKLENDIRTKFQGIDFSKQRKRDFYFEKIIKSKIYNKLENKKSENGKYGGLYNVDYFVKTINFEINEKKYMFLENNKFIPTVRYNDFKERFKIFNLNLKENPNYSTLINYISNK